MRPRIADQLREMGCEATAEEFRRVLADTKAELFPDLTDEHLAFTRHEAERYCKEVRARVACQKLPRVFILTQLVGLRKNKPKAAKAD